MPHHSNNYSSVLNNGRPTIAVLAGTIVSLYQESIMRGAAYVAEEKGYNLIGFCGGAINSDDPVHLAREKVFELVDMDLISGVISPFSSLMRFLDQQASEAFLNRFSSVPVINVGSYIEGYTNIVADHEAGFQALFKHFYHVHGYRHILLVRGPKTHGASEIRTDIFKKLLTQYQLPFHDDMVIYSDLNRNSTKVSMGIFFDQTDKPYDAVITLNDNQALGILDACQERGINVPTDIAVVGSLNSLEGAFSTPALTSIQEPLFELGRIATLELIAQIEGKAPQAEIKIPTSLIIRQSCGCESSIYNDNDNEQKNLLSVNKGSTCKEAEDYLELVVKQYKGGILCEEVASLIGLYKKGVHKQDFDRLLTELKLKLEKAIKSEDIMLWLEFSSKLAFSALHALDLDRNSTYLITFMKQLMALKSEAEQTAIKFQRFESEYYLNYFRAIVNNLNTSFDLTRIKKYTVDILQLSELYISLFPDVNSDVSTATNMVSVRHNKFIEVENRDFIAKKLIPDEVETYSERYTLLVFPLSFRMKTLGFMAVNLSNPKGTAFENLRAIISSALKNEILIQDLKKAEKRFSDIAHSTSNWLWETDVSHQFTYCSDSAIDVIGYSVVELLGKKINSFNLNEGDSYIKGMLNYEDITESECWCGDRDGKVICLLISAKPIMLEGSFHGYRGVFEDITEQKLQEEKIKKLAYSDILTGLPNRTLFQDKLTETISFSFTNQKKFALMFIDLDHFKNINDSMGHATGDLLLIKIANILKRSIRSRDIIARLGGDEFVIILPDIKDEGDIIKIAEHIFKSIKKPILLNDKQVYSALSLGISIYPNDGLDAQTLLQKGDNAMYQAKLHGRNGYVFYDKLLEQKNTLRNMYEEILRHALVTDGFINHYQAQVSAETGTIVGFEVLVRIFDEQKGIVGPNHFIPLAEELGLIGQIDEQVFEKSCAQHKKWREIGLNNVRLSINLSALQLRNDAILANYIQILARYEIAPSDIQIEITENALIENADVALKILQGFKEHGVSIALDDFGTGYSSLNCINLYPIDTIKIDRSFVKDVVDNPKNKAIIQGVLLIARNLNLKIIAEGVETKEQYELMTQLGCDEIQGYFFYKPCPASDAQILLEEMKKTP